jgi:hypothetical protein
MSDGGEETICIGREINSFDTGFQVENGADERGVLMTEPVMFLTCPGTSFDVIETSDILSPGTLMTDFDELRVLNHHGMHDSQKCLVGGENSSSSCQCIT